jgi:hypothetical protein
MFDYPVISSRNLLRSRKRSDFVLMRDGEKGWKERVIYTCATTAVVVNRWNEVTAEIWIAICILQRRLPVVCCR